MRTRKSVALSVVFVGVALEHFDVMLVNLFADYDGCSFYSDLE